MNSNVKKTARWTVAIDKRMQKTLILRYSLFSIIYSSSNSRCEIPALTCVVVLDYDTSGFKTNVTQAPQSENVKKINRKTFVSKTRAIKIRTRKLKN